MSITVYSRPTGAIYLPLRTWVLKQNRKGRNVWKTVITSSQVEASRTAIILCDLWDDHWSRGASERVAAMAPRINQALHVARVAGVTIIHAPSDTMEFYRDSPARKRVQQAARVDPPPDAPHDDPPLPIDDSDNGSDTGEAGWHVAWTREHPAITIDEDRDGISENGREIYSFLRQQGIRNVLLAGVHTNMCILKRSFGIKQMVRWGVNIALVRDFTDALYNPARSPYVSHTEGVRLVVEYIEKFWCPTVSSAELLAALRTD